MDSDLVARLRREYSNRPFGEDEAGEDPVALFDEWFDEAIAAGLPEPHAVALSTASLDAMPSVRIVLLKSFTSEGAVIATNFESRKARELAENPRASLVTLWHPQFRQVRIEGVAHKVSDAESDEIFAARPRGAQIASVTSLQSHSVADRAAIEERYRRDERAIGSAPVARPHHWGGIRISLERFEFWQGRENRLHDRIVFEREGSGWRRYRVQP